MYKNRVVIATVFTIIIFFIFRHCTGIGASAVETFSSCVLYPLLRVQQLIVEPVTIWLARSTSIAELEKKVENLQKKYDEIFTENIALKALLYDKNETNELRDFNKKYLLQRGKLAQILARHFSSNNQFFLVDAGSCQGVKKDMVALHCNAIVGRVVEVYPWYCKVCLITDADCKVAALCLPHSTPLSHKASSYAPLSPRLQSAGKATEDKSEGFSSKGCKGFQKGVSGIHEGINDSVCTVMRYVSHLELIEVGDDVLSSGEGLIFPRGFALGKVLSADKGELFYTITIRPVLDFTTLRYCTLIAKEHIE